jgi:hypothetical protein
MLPSSHSRKGPALSTVAATIAQYKAAIASEDHVAAAKILVALEAPAFQNLQDWEAIRKFLTEEKLHGRLEIITKRFIKTGQVNNARPYYTVIPLIAKSGQHEEARNLLRQCRAKFGDVPEFRWVYTNVLLDTKQFAEALREARLRRAENPELMGYGILEVRALLGLNERAAARGALKKLTATLPDKADDWQWCLFLSLQMKERALTEVAHDKIIRLVESGVSTITPAIITGLNLGGFKASVVRVLKSADPARYQTVEELAEMFETALHYGEGKIAGKFGQAVLARDPQHKLRPQIADVLAGKTFLMA